MLTDYNNKTYRIDDVIFEKSALDTFLCKETEKSFVEYYYEVTALLTTSKEM